MQFLKCHQWIVCDGLTQINQQSNSLMRKGGWNVHKTSAVMTNDKKFYSNGPSRMQKAICHSHISHCKWLEWKKYQYSIQVEWVGNLDVR